MPPRTRIEDYMELERVFIIISMARDLPRLKILASFSLIVHERVKLFLHLSDR